MIGRDSCGCLYLVCGEVTRCVQACDRDAHDDEWHLGRGLREPKGELEPLPTERVVSILSEWGHLIADGYAMRDLMRTLNSVKSRREYQEAQNPTVG